MRCIVEVDRLMGRETLSLSSLFILEFSTIALYLLESLQQLSYFLLLNVRGHTA